jgi:hypothetical protein
MLVLSHSRSM